VCVRVRVCVWCVPPTLCCLIHSNLGASDGVMSVHLTQASVRASKRVVCVCVCVFGRALRARARLLDLCMP
jgi:hypothetical protein